jgi:hypothetical protein
MCLQIEKLIIYGAYQTGGGGEGEINLVKCFSI